MSRQKFMKQSHSQVISCRKVFWYHSIVHKLWVFSCILIFRSSRSEVFLGKNVLKIYSKFTGEHPYRSVISIKLLWSFIEITLQNTFSLEHLWTAEFWISHVIQNQYIYLQPILSSGQIVLITLIKGKGMTSHCILLSRSKLKD